MFSRVAMRYKREPIKLMYSLWSVALPFSSISNAVVMLIGIDTGLSSAMLNFFHWVLCVLGLMYEGTLLHLLELDT
jgi:hypothetical protein